MNVAMNAISGDSGETAEPPPLSQESPLSQEPPCSQDLQEENSCEILGEWHPSDPEDNSDVGEPLPNADDEYAVTQSIEDGEERKAKQQEEALKESAELVQWWRGNLEARKASIESEEERVRFMKELLAHEKGQLKKVLEESQASAGLTSAVSTSTSASSSSATSGPEPDSQVSLISVTSSVGEEKDS